MSPSAIPAPRIHGFTQGTNTPLYWCRYGTAGAPPVVVLHGGPGAHHDYLLPQLLDLADTYDLLFYDQRGGGQSKTDDRTPITWHTHVTDLAAVLAELEPAPPTILGYSWGGMLALLYAVEAASGRVTPAPARLALIDPAPLSRPWRTEFEAEFARRQLSAEVQTLRDALTASGLRETDPAAYRQRTFELSVAGYFADPRRATDLTPFRVTGRVQQSVWESLGEFDLIPDLAKVPYDVQIIHGRQDPIPLESSEAAARALRAELVVLEDCGHVPYVEAHGSLMAALRRFLRRPDAV